MFDRLKKMILGTKAGGEKPLNMYQYKFLRYKEEREKRIPLDLSKVHVPQIDGLVSVILPVYNGADILAESIESVLAQTYTNFEFIIINDGSKDNSLEIARSYAAKDKRIKVLSQENKKIPRTLSRGFRESKGEFLTWTSADNVMDRDFLEKMVGDLKSTPETGMIYANMRLIDAKGKKLRNHGWFEYPIGSSNVIFPDNAYELNTYANNTIGAAFMYRAAAKEILGCYSSYKHTLEDYDYWMRMNNLLKLRHTFFKEPVYSYRWHDNSLTAKDAELGITKNRYKLMVLDDFRRDFCLSPLLWYIEGEVENADALKEVIRKSGQTVIEKKDFSKLFFGKSIPNLCYVSFGGGAPLVSLPHDTVRICVDKSTDADTEFDIYASLKKGRADFSGDGIKEYVFDDTENMFYFIEAKAKNDILYKLEERIESKKNYSKKLSAVVCTYKASETLKKCVKALCNQTADKNDYEIVFVNNDFENCELKELVQNISAQYPETDISYVTAPIKGLSYARNCGLWTSEGEIVLYIDDDAIADKNLIAETLKGFEKYEDMGVIGGQVIVDVPADKGDIVNENTISMWSNLKIDGDCVRYSKDYGEFPYGANFAVRSTDLMQIGGFRCNYGRVGENFGGGEETLVCFMMEQINKKVGLNPKSVVSHEVSGDRFTLEHIEKTAYAGILTQYNLRRDLYAPLDWNDINVRERAAKAEKNAEKCKEGSADYVLYKATARAFRDVFIQRQKDYEFLNKNKG